MTMATNGPVTTLAREPNKDLCPANSEDVPRQFGTPTLESLQRDLAAFSTSKDEIIEDLRSRLRDAEHESLEYKLKLAESFIEKKSLRDKIKNLEASIETDGGGDQRLNGQLTGGAPVIDISTDAAGDRDMKLLREENASLKEAMRKLESQMGSSSIKDHLDAFPHVRLGGTHPESCPSSMSSESFRSRDSPDWSGNVEADCKVADRPNTHLAPAARGVQPAGTATVEIDAVTAAAASQATAFDKLQSTSPSAADSSSNGKVIEGAITPDMIDWLSDHVGRDWKPLLRKLGVTDNAIEIITEDYKSSIKDQRYKGFREWKKTSSKATVDVLLRAMSAKSHHQLSRDFCKEYKLDLSEQLAKNTPCKMTGQQAIEADSVPLVTSSALERFMHPFLNRNAFSTLVSELHNCAKFSKEQSLKLGYQSQKGNDHVAAVLEHCCSLYYQGNDSDDELEKRQALWKILRTCGTEVRNVIKKHVNQGGVIGPAEKEDSKIEELPYSTISKIEELLSLEEGMRNWKDLAEWLKTEHSKVFQRVDKNKIRLWEKDSDPHKGAKNVLSIWETTTQAKVGILYLWVVENGRLDVAKEME